MTSLVTTDWHLDEQEQNEYRWDVFRHVRMAAQDHGVDKIYHLGDLVDRKDRFPATFVNRILDEIRATGAVRPLTILRGNHDTPLNGPAFFEFINQHLDRVRYITSPAEDGDALLLPHHPNPVEAWRGLRFGDFKAAFMHVTVTGALTENGFEIEHGTRLPILPRNLKIYSGDVHVPQQCRNITYVGCPHGIKFGDDFPCRMLILGDDYEIKTEIKLDPSRKRVIRVSSVEELRKVSVRSGDQARIEFRLATKDVENYSAIEQEVSAWSRETGVTVASHEFVIAETSTGADLDLDVAPETLLRQFAEEEGVAEGLLATGLELLRGVKK